MLFSFHCACNEFNKVIRKTAIWSVHDLFLLKPISLSTPHDSLKSRGTKSLEDDPVEDLAWDKKHSDATVVGTAS